MNAPSKSLTSHRKLVNYLLDPLQQLRLGMISVVTSLVFVTALGAFVYSKLMQFTDVVITLTQADVEIHALLSKYLGSVATTTLIGSLVFIVANMALTIYFSHKMVGQIVAFRRHIGHLMNGKFDAKTKLRHGDAFTEVAEDLNKLSDRLSDLIRKGN